MVIRNRFQGSLYIIPLKNMLNDNWNASLLRLIKGWMKRKIWVSFWSDMGNKRRGVMTWKHLVLLKRCSRDQHRWIHTSSQKSANILLISYTLISSNCTRWGSNDFAFFFCSRLWPRRSRIQILHCGPFAHVYKAESPALYTQHPQRLTTI